MNRVNLNDGRLRDAIARGSFEEAQPVLRDFAWELAALLKTIPPADPAALAALRQSADLLEWARRMACAGRARASTELSRLSAALPYREIPDRLGATWRLDG